MNSTQPTRPDLILEKAINILDERGWTREVFQNDQGQVCARGAINLAGCNNTYKNPHASWATRDAIIAFDVVRKIEPLVINFNDYVAKSKRDVQRLLRKAATKYRRDNGLATPPGIKRL